MKAISLMYHDVSPVNEQESSGFAGADAARYKLTPEAFERHLRAMQSRTAAAPTTVDRLPNCGLPILLTFDDGGESAVRTADTLERYGWRGHFFLTTGWIGRPGFLQKAAIRDLRRRGHVIGSHSHTHPLRMSCCSDARLRSEWTHSIAILSDMTGERVTCASVPGGYSSGDVVLTAAEAGVRFLFTSRPTARIRRIGDTLVLGRYVIRRFTSAGVVGAIAAGNISPRWTQAAVWGAKHLCKTLTGVQYLNIREWILGRSPRMQWGDEDRRASKNPS